MDPELLAQLTYAIIAVTLLAPLPLAAAIWSRSRRLAGSLLFGWICAIAVAVYGFWRVDNELSESVSVYLWFFFYTPALTFGTLIVATFAAWLVLRLMRR